MKVGKKKVPSNYHQRRQGKTRKLQRIKTEMNERQNKREFILFVIGLVTYINLELKSVGGKRLLYKFSMRRVGRILARSFHVNAKHNTLDIFDRTRSLD